jgi:hypothetical protein
MLCHAYVKVLGNGGKRRETYGHERIETTEMPIMIADFTL